MKSGDEGHVAEFSMTNDVNVNSFHRDVTFLTNETELSIKFQLKMTKTILYIDLEIKMSGEFFKMYFLPKKKKTSKTLIKKCNPDKCEANEKR